jgi:hypothetical protein
MWQSQIFWKPSSQHRKVRCTFAFRLRCLLLARKSDSTLFARNSRFSSDSSDDEELLVPGREEARSRDTVAAAAAYSNAEVHRCVSGTRDASLSCRVMQCKYSQQRETPSWHFAYSATILPISTPCSVSRMYSYLFSLS